MKSAPTPYDALLIVAFGGPEKPADVMPFLENVTRGRNIPRERLDEVARHYHHFGGRSPINDQVRALITSLRAQLDQAGLALPIYWGNRNWHPTLPDAVQQMTADGVRRALAIVLAAYSSYSSCRQYRENIEAARQATGPTAPTIDKLRVFYNHPDFIAANADRLAAALDTLPVAERPRAHIAFTAHSIPATQAKQCDYAKQLMETARLVADSCAIPAPRWKLVYQSRSGRPQDPWLEPDILDHLDALARQDVRAVAVCPMGFLSDHMEILYDLDEEAKHSAESLGMSFTRAQTVGTHPRFVAMLRELIVERLAASPERRAIGSFPSSHDICPADCCPGPARPAGETAPSPLPSCGSF
jgi:ferrochelatase